MNTLTLQHMTTPNTRVVDEVLGSNYVAASANDSLCPAEVVEANHALADYVYGNDVAQLLRARRIDDLDKLHADTFAEVVGQTDSLHRINPNAIGLVVLRTEIVELAGDYEALLAAQGLAVVMNKEMKIDFRQYWSMYHHGLIHPGSYVDFPTRTLNYVDKPLRLLAVTGSLEATQGQTVSDYLHSFKGKQGYDQPGTLRGGIAFTALNTCLSPENMLGFEDAPKAMALDPIGTYRQLTRNTVLSDGLHNLADSPLLFYAGQAVHVPDGQEILRDLSILCTDEEVDSLNHRLQTNII